MPLVRGPDLPYKLVAGAVPWRRGWLVVSTKLHGVTVAIEDPRVFDTFVDIIDEKPSYSIIAVFAPIGFLDERLPRGRTCDREARALLGPRRGAAIRSAPSRAIFDGEPDASEPLDAVTAIRLPQYREVAAEMAPYRQRSVYETHPELVFYELNDLTPLQYAKRFEAGRAERVALLEAKIPGVDRALDATLPGVTLSQLLDATACMWAARRIIVRAGIRIPQDPEWDSQGLRMEIVR